MSSLNSILNDTSTKEGKIFAFFIQTLIVLSLISFSIGTLPSNSPKTNGILNAFEVITVTIFTIEYLLRVVFATKKTEFIFSFFGIIDLLSILPFYLSFGCDLRVIRIFRLFRIVRVLKLFKYNSAINRFHKALILVKEELILFGFATAVILYLSAVGIYYFENTVQPEQFKSVFHSLWWAVTTLTTVGYGDMFPVTLGGRLFTFVVLMIGLGIVAIPTGLIAFALSQVRSEE